jgi:hypothetical protein
MGFDNCPVFEGNLGSLLPKEQVFWPPGSCPYCDLSGLYDMNTVRTITKVTPGRQFGPSARKGGGIPCIIL